MIPAGPVPVVPDGPPVVPEGPEPAGPEPEPAPDGPSPDLLLDDADGEEPAVSAQATPPLVAIAPNTPRARASAPTRPTYFA